MIRGSLLAATFALGLISAASAQPELGLPVNCVMNRDCFVQQYPDTDPSISARDFTCNSLSYEGHSGTDFATRDRQLMRDGVQVVAAAAGRVVGVRDGGRDVDVSTIGGREAVKGIECGNGVAGPFSNAPIFERPV